MTECAKLSPTASSVITGGEPSSAEPRALLKGPGVARSCRERGRQVDEDACGLEFKEDYLVLSTRESEAMPQCTIVEGRESGFKAIVGVA